MVREALSDDFWPHVEDTGLERRLPAVSPPISRGCALLVKQPGSYEHRWVK
jgi:hypothetical protein